MTENEARINVIAEDYKAVLHEAKSMGCNDIRTLYHIPIKNIELIVQALEEIQQYRAIGTVEECRAAVEKQKAKKPIEPDEEYGTFKCHNCGGLIFTVDRFETHKYCLLCGQKLDWEGYEE